jgi:hypothetical protein
MEKINISELFDEPWAGIIRENLPRIFQEINLDNTREDRIGMQVGHQREKAIIGLLAKLFGYNSVNVVGRSRVNANNLPLTVITTSSKYLSGIKINWTVDAEKSEQYITDYEPDCNILLVHIQWDGLGGLYYIPVEAQQDVILGLGTLLCLKPPKAGTNARGIEIKSQVLKKLMVHKLSLRLEIEWNKIDIDYDLVQEGLDYWQNVSGM